MPLYKKIFFEHCDIAIWRIEEDMSFFQAKFSNLPEIQNENKRLQWFATRFLANEILGSHAEIVKDESGKPWLKDSAHHISISHSAQFAAVMMSNTKAVGIDLEPVNEKVERIAPKFLRSDEIDAINAAEKTRKLILYWSAKESLYKLYGKGGIEFTTQLLISPFDLQDRGELSAEIKAAEHLTGLKVQYEFFEGHVLSYVVGLENY
ncbi:MAG: 4-phosphopantetheinyl transferase superfamily protein [Bacteroidota bacterium]|nr:4-phosphopantetheinyl transferase superfamily protein [Bacteroidota bacterium]